MPKFLMSVISHRSPGVKSACTAKIAFATSLPCTKCKLVFCAKASFVPAMRETQFPGARVALQSPDKFNTQPPTSSNCVSARPRSLVGSIGVLRVLSPGWFQTEVKPSCMNFAAEVRCVDLYRESKVFVASADFNGNVISTLCC